MFIDGEWCEAASGGRFEVTDPAIGEVIGDAPDLILKGPNFEHGFSIPPTSHGAGSELLPWRGGLIQVNSGEDWSGSVVHILPPKESVAPRN